MRMTIRKKCKVLLDFSSLAGDPQPCSRGITPITGSCLARTHIARDHAAGNLPANSWSPGHRLWLGFWHCLANGRERRFQSQIAQGSFFGIGNLRGDPICSALLCPDGIAYGLGHSRAEVCAQTSKVVRYYAGRRVGRDHSLRGIGSVVGQHYGHHHRLSNRRLRGIHLLSGGQFCRRWPTGDPHPQ